MAKFYGKIGFVVTEETSPSVYIEKQTEKKCYGEVISDSFRWQQGDKINNDLVINNAISIIADTFVHENIGAMRWVEYMGIKWKIDSIKINFPRLELNLGGQYNE